MTYLLFRTLRFAVGIKRSAYCEPWRRLRLATSVAAYADGRRVYGQIVHSQRGVIMMMEKTEKTKKRGFLRRGKVNALKKILRGNKVFLPKEAIASIGRAINVNDHYDIRLVRDAVLAYRGLIMVNRKRYYADCSVMEDSVLEKAQVVFGNVSSFGCDFFRDYCDFDVELIAHLDHDINDDTKRHLGMSDQDIADSKGETCYMLPHSKAMTQWLDHVDNGMISLRWDPEFDATTPFVIIIDRKSWLTGAVRNTHDIFIYYPDPSRLH